MRLGRRWAAVVLRWPAWYWVAGIILLLVSLPWPAMKDLTVLDRFDPVLATVNERGYLRGKGSVKLEPGLLAISAVPRSQPTVHLLTTESAFRARFAVRVIGVTAHEVYPVQIKLWNPSKDVALETWFGAPPSRDIHMGYRLRSRWIVDRRVGAYKVGLPLAVEVWRTDQEAGIRLSSPRWIRELRVTPVELPMLFLQDNLSVTVYASSPADGSAEAEYTNYRVSLPDVGPYGAILQGSLARVIAVAVWLVTISCLVLETVKKRKNRQSAGRLVPETSCRRERIAFISMVFLFVFISMPLLTISGHPYDIHSNQLWAYVAARYSLSALYTTAAVATEGNSHGGDPYAAAAFPYPPLMGYFFKAVGEIYERVGGGSWLRDPSLTAGLKLGYLSFHIVGAFVARHLLTRAGLSERSQVVAMSVYVFNPVILWDTIVWGQADTILLLALLVALVGIVERRSAVAWIGILAAASVKQTGVPFAAILAALLAREVGLRDLVRGFARSTLWLFLFLAPLMWSGVHPVSFVYPVWRKVLQFGTVRWMEVSNAVVARDGFNLWTLLTYVAGARGIVRMAFPDYVRLPWLPVSPVDVARLLAVGLVGYLGFLLLKSSQPVRTAVAEERPSNIVVIPSIALKLLLVAAYFLGLVFISTRITARYYVFGLAFLATGASIFPGRLPWLAYCAVTVSVLVGMYGSMVQISEWYPGLLPEFAAEGHLLNALALRLYVSDGWISAFSALILLAVIALLISVRRAAQAVLTPGRVQRGRVTTLSGDAQHAREPSA